MKHKWVSSIQIELSARSARDGPRRKGTSGRDCVETRGKFNAGLWACCLPTLWVMRQAGLLIVDKILHISLSKTTMPTPLLATTLQAAVLGGVSNVLAQTLTAYQGNV